MILEELLEELEYRNFVMSDKFRIHPSMMEQCSRAICLSAIGLKPYTDRNMDLIFCTANNLHNHIQMLIGNSIDDINVQSEIPCECPEYLVSGTADIVLSGDFVRNRIGKDKMVVEVKSRPYLSKDTAAHISHITQIEMYMHMLGVEYGEILYISRANGAYSVCPINYKYGYVEEHFRRLDSIFDSLESGELPDPDCDCGACYYDRYCCASDSEQFDNLVIKMFNESLTEEYKQRRPVI